MDVSHICKWSGREGGCSAPPINWASALFSFPLEIFGRFFKLQIAKLTRAEGNSLHISLALEMCVRKVGEMYFSSSWSGRRLVVNSFNQQQIGSKVRRRNLVESHTRGPAIPPILVKRGNISSSSSSGFYHCPMGPKV